jgi:hypothetical protein
MWHKIINLFFFEYGLPLIYHSMDTVNSVITWYDGSFTVSFHFKVLYVFQCPRLYLYQYLYWKNISIHI